MSAETTESSNTLKCPNCQKKLRIEDPQFIGKRVKCPQCKVPFLVEIPGSSLPPQKSDIAQTPQRRGIDEQVSPPESGPGLPPAQLSEQQAVLTPASVPVSPPSSSSLPEAPPVLPSQSANSANHESLEDEEEVQFELVNDAPPVGTSAKWIPDTPFSTPPVTPKGVVSPPRASDPLINVQPVINVQPTGASQPVVAPIVSPIAAETEGSSLQRLRNRRKKSWGPTIIVSLFLVLGIGTITYLVMTTEPYKPTVATTPEGGPPVEDFDAPVNENQPYSRERLAYRPQLVDEFKPTQGKPLSLAMMPRGVSFIIHIRPSLLWSNAYQYQELKASLTDDLTNWIASQLKELCRRDPEQIEEAYLGFILGAGGTEPEVCAVVYLKEPAKLSDLIDEFKGEYVYDITEKPELRLKRDDKYAYLIKNERTFAIAPRLYAAELEEAQSQPFVLSVPMENLLRETDQNRLLTVLGVVRDLRIHYPKMMPASSHVAVEQFLEWIGEDENLEAMSWSLHPEPYFHSEMKIHPTSVSNPAQLNQFLQEQLAALPETVWKKVCRKMSPKELRFRNFIGRLPAMLEAYRQSTISTTSANYVSMTTVLPAKAAPNLALATMFTFNEAARTDFDAEIVVVSNKPKLPETIVERLRIPVDSEFNRRPLEMALQYLCDEIEVKLEVDGDALKDAGYTKNMPQTFNLGVVPVERSFAHIVNSYQEVGKVMVMSIDEKSKTIHILTEKFAKQRNLPIYEFNKE